MSLRVALFDYGAGNLHSLGKALEAEGADVRITSDWGEVLALDALVLPGVGAFGQATAALPEERGPLLEALRDGHPCLGICLGMQLLFATSEESAGDGLGLIDGSVRLIEAPIVPQMGWNDVDLLDDPIFDGLDALVAYYANSYVCVPASRDRVIGWTEYAGRRHAAAVRAANSWGVQFHPEKSSLAGRRVIANFVSLAAAASGRSRVASARGAP